ncbi:MAG: FAD-dependent oxidoreductase [Verrucomicrobia bacterium]|nr:FAD-dependent oxidoreductase [Verrucomicrobiota bacterium]MCG2678529.1 FAD-dependent oxidoreductase [Kiritimatiellia bacterium]MBU4247444.1 FAD-dependent oxidoreductase [Verrucomicrobiota bacterium]MBU4292275.1 FAD-dependent oxidoreductase [Verrucomicrobiota bacterium]MBU4429822.1 FAD-dependent oxidoreductase [Verrucomicrobiota bacterium]
MTIEKSYDLVVIGGGLAGVGAAISAARHGCRTALVQDRPVLGGNSSSEIRMHVCGADSKYDGLARRETGIIEELRLENLVRNPQNSPSMWDLLLFEWVRREPSLDLYLNSLALEPVMANAGRIEAVRVRQLASEQEFLLAGRFFADCSGDGHIAAQAGADFHRGREAADDYGESLAHSAADKYSLGSSLMFMARDMGRPMPFVKPDWAHTFPTDESLAHRGHSRYRYGYWWIEWGGQLDPIADNEAIRDELLKIVLGVWDHIKNHGNHGADQWALEWVGVLPGKRESRRFIGDYILCQKDLEAGRIFPDAVAYGGWPIDTHPVEGFRSPEHPCRQISVPLYTIPLRSLYSRNIDNLFFAGRNISATHIAFASTRVMSTCAVMGQAIGATAAACIRRGWTPPQAAGEGIAEIQQRLLADDCFIPGQVNRDGHDLARKAMIIASGSTGNNGPEAVIDGLARKTESGEHCWESQLLTDGEAWIELHWPTPQIIGRLQLTFDSHLEERLIFTQEEHIYTCPNILTNIPQRLVKDFTIQALEQNTWRTVRAVAGNHQRHRKELFSPSLKTAAIRIGITSTHGAPTARILEIRGYADRE